MAFSWEPGQALWCAQGLPTTPAQPISPRFVLQDETAAGTDAEAFLRELRRRAGAGAPDGGASAAEPAPGRSGPPGSSAGAGPAIGAVEDAPSFVRCEKRLVAAPPEIRLRGGCQRRRCVAAEV